MSTEDNFSPDDILGALDFSPEDTAVLTYAMDNYGMPEGGWASEWLASLLASCMLNVQAAEAPYGLFQVINQDADLFGGQAPTFNTQVAKIAVSGPSQAMPLPQLVLTTLHLENEHARTRPATILVQHIAALMDDGNRQPYLLGIYTTRSGRQMFALHPEGEQLTDLEVFEMDRLNDPNLLLPVPGSSSNLETIEFLANVCTLLYALPMMRSRNLVEMVEDHVTHLLAEAALATALPVANHAARLEFIQTLLSMAAPAAVSSAIRIADLLFSDSLPASAPPEGSGPDPLLIMHLLQSTAPGVQVLQALQEGTPEPRRAYEQAARDFLQKVADTTWEDLTPNAASPILGTEQAEAVALWGPYLLADYQYASRAAAETSAKKLVTLIGVDGYRHLRKSVLDRFGIVLTGPA